MKRIALQQTPATDPQTNPAEALPFGHGRNLPISIDADALDDACNRCAAHSPALPSHPLGKKTKSVSASPDRSRKKSPAKRDNRYVFQDEARRVMVFYGRMKRMEYPQNIHRVAKCGRHRIYKTNYVDIHYSPSYEAAHYAGLIQCGSPWACPVCSAKLAERRREEIAKGFDHVYSSGGKMIMVTLTFPHTAFDKVGDLLPKQAAALKKLRGTRAWQKVKHEHGLRHMIRSLEITHGDSGWHPHTHEAWWVDKDADAEALREQITEHWARACRKVGLLKPDSEDHFHAYAVHVLDNATSSAYLQKQDQQGTWGCDRELAGGGSKISKGRHPFSLLEASAAGDANAQFLFVEYALATKGKAQIFWSRGFKAEAGVNDKTDEELVEEQEEDAVRVVSLSPLQWEKVLDENARGEILTLVEEQGFIGVARWFADRDLAPPDRPRSPPLESPP